MSWFKLKEPMGTNYRVDSGDIVNTKRALNQLGYYNVSPERDRRVDRRRYVQGHPFISKEQCP